MTYPCNSCNRDEGSPICLGDERCQRTDGMRAQTLMPNGLTAAETAATASVAGLRDPHRGGSSYEASMLRNLLARIHGDGGHYVEQHGLDKALADADEMVAGWRAAQPAEPLYDGLTLDQVKERLAVLGADDLRGMVVSLLIQQRIAERAFAATQPA